MTSFEGSTNSIIEPQPRLLPQEYPRSDWITVETLVTTSLIHNDKAHTRCQVSIDICRHRQLVSKRPAITASQGKVKVRFNITVLAIYGEGLGNFTLTRIV